MSDQRIFRLPGNRRFRDLQCPVAFLAPISPVAATHEGVTRHRMGMAQQINVDEPFGAVLGVNSGVPAYSCDYETWRVPKGEREWRHTHEGVLTGYKWQCVEYARRWLLVNRGVTFGDVGMAYEIMDLKTVTVQTPGPRKGTELPLYRCENGGPVPPVAGAMLIWGRDWDRTGHVAIITEVVPGKAMKVRIAEQNNEDWKWAAGNDYAREMPLEFKDGRYTIVEPEGFSVLGWMVQAEHDPNFPEDEEARGSGGPVASGSSPVASTKPVT